MAYEFKPSPEHSVMRSKYTGEWILQERNPHYGYYATIATYGEKLRPQDIGDIARRVGVDAGNFARHIESVVRHGGSGMRPRPGFEINSTTKL